MWYTDVDGADLGLLLLGLLLLLLCLCLGDGSQSLLLADGSGLVAPGGDSGEISTDDATLVLDGFAGTLLGDLLGDTLLVHPAVDYCPGDLTGVLALEERGCIF